MHAEALSPMDAKPPAFATTPSATPLPTERASLHTPDARNADMLIGALQLNASFSRPLPTLESVPRVDESGLFATKHVGAVWMQVEIFVTKLHATGLHCSFLKSRFLLPLLVCGRVHACRGSGRCHEAFLIAVAARCKCISVRLWLSVR